MIALLAASVLAQGAPATAPDPHRLPLNGTTREVAAPLNQIVRTSDGKVVTVDDVAAAADGKRWVFLGEEHATKAHQDLHAAVIQALVKRGRKVIVGMEMFTRPKQAVLNEWSTGALDEAAFIEKAEWKTQWGFDYAFYKPVFDAVKANRLPLVALNVPRDWVRAVGRGGWEALTPEQQAELPKDPDFKVADHKAFFTALIGGHPLQGRRGETMYQAQVLWDVAMADTAIKFRSAHPDDAVTVVLAGWGHIGYDSGINQRVRVRTGETGISLVMVSSAADTQVSNGLADFVFVAERVAK